MPRKKKDSPPAEPAIGHNSNLRDDDKVRLGRLVIEIERVEAEISNLSAEKSEIYKSAKEAGFDTKALRHEIKLRRLEKSERADFEAACEAYRLALGDFASTDLGRSAAPRPEPMF